MLNFFSPQSQHECTFEVEFAVGYEHGSWEIETIEVRFTDPEYYTGFSFDQDLFETAEEALSDKLGYNKNISFIHPMYFHLVE